MASAASATTDQSKFQPGVRVRGLAGERAADGGVLISLQPDQVGGKILKIEPTSRKHMHSEYKFEYILHMTETIPMHVNMHIYVLHVIIS